MLSDPLSAFFYHALCPGMLTNMDYLSGFPILWFLSLAHGSPGWRSVGKTTGQGIYSPTSVPWILGLTLVRPYHTAFLLGSCDSSPTSLLRRRDSNSSQSLLALGCWTMAPYFPQILPPLLLKLFVLNSHEFDETLSPCPVHYAIRFLPGCWSSLGLPIKLHFKQRAHFKHGDRN